MSILSVALAQGNIDIQPNAGGRVSLDAIDNIGDLISAGIGAAFLIAGILVFIMLIWGGIQWITSGGDKENTQKARDRITHALVGLTIIAGAWALMQLIQFFFGISVLNGVNLPSAADL